MKSLSEIQTIITDEIAKMDLVKEPEGLYLPIKYALDQGGKRIRPSLTLLACDLFGGDVYKSVNAALGLEIFHNFTLLHDDIMDKADVRRGQPTVHKKWGENTAILSGDVMQIIAYEYICKVPEKELSRILTAFSKMGKEICEGQQYDMEFENRNNVTSEEYLNMIRLKTAVLLGTALQIGAWIGGADEKNARFLYDFGINIGLAFQLKDDWLDVYGDEKIFGKKIGGDINCNKKTYLLVEALKLAVGEDAKELEQWLDAEPCEAKIKAVISLYNRLGVKAVCERKMDYLYNEALECLDKISIADESKSELRKLAQKLILRED